ncbi:hypothetical protein F2Q69_00024803 [Brassica cretica]|uniref:Uncharacterized protein n=1 Tax=Brassica cretica TaxID=69181 RepID=A0A8S9QKT8_BRACR|nr:hypothetical protein F2Q69_00024803 [Brassica cretica]
MLEVDESATAEALPASLVEFPSHLLKQSVSPIPPLMDLPEIPPFRKKDPPPQSNNNHASAVPSSTTAVTTAPSDDGHFDVAPANSNQVPKASQPHEAPQTQPYVPLQSEETMEEEQAPFVPSMGAWSKPLVLKFPPPFTPPESSTPCSYDPELVQIQSWCKARLRIFGLPWGKILGQELGLQKTVLTPQHVPFQFGKPGESSPDIYTSPATTKSMSLQVAIPQKDSSATFGKSSLDTKFTLSSTLAGTSSSHTSLQVMDDVPSEIIMNEGSILSENNLLKKLPLSTEPIQEVSNMDFHITEQMDEFRSMTRGGRLIKPTQRYQDMGWVTIRGRGKRGRRGRGSYQAH